MKGDLHAVVLWEPEGVIPSGHPTLAKGPHHQSEPSAESLVHLRVAASDFQLDYVAIRHEAELFAEELADSTLNATVTIDDEVHAGMLPLPFWNVPPHEG